MKQNKYLTKCSRELRKNATKEENTLWYQYLRRYPAQFRRQCVVGPFILDFYCAKALLAVELDGSGHYEPEKAEKDARRTAYLNSLGIHVLRFSNTEVNSNLSGVCQYIDMAVQYRILHPENTAIGRKSYDKKQL